MIDDERHYHEAFAAARTRIYVEPPDVFATLDEAVAAGQPLTVVTGASGVGKSALLANWSRHHRSLHPGDLVIEEYVGAISSGVDHGSMLRRIMLIIRRELDIDEEIPHGDAAIVRAFPSWLAYLQRTRSILVLDGLDALDERSQELEWLPEHLPPDVLIVASAADSDALDALLERGARTVQVPALRLAERRSIAERILAGGYGHGASAFSARDALVERSDDATGWNSSARLLRLTEDGASANPLFLGTRVEELRHVTPGENERITELLAATSLDDLFDRVLDQVEDACGARSVREAMLAIWGARRGMSRTELADVSEISIADLERLLYRLQFHLIERGELVTFLHDRFRRAVETRYVVRAGLAAESVHRRLAEYFRKRGVDARRIEEEPWQWVRANQPAELVRALGEVEMFMGLAEESRRHEMLTYWRALEGREDLVALCDRVASSAGNEGAWPRSTVLRTIGTVLRDAGRYAEAESYCRRACALTEAEPESQEHALAISALATLLYQRGQHAESQRLFEEGVGLCEGAFGEHDKETLANIRNLGASYFAQRKYDDARLVFERSLDLDERYLGERHPHTLSTLNNLASVYKTQGDLKGAEERLRRVVTLAERSLGALHPRVATYRMNLALVLQELGENDVAEQLYLAGIAAKEQALGTAHPETALAWGNYGEYLRRRERFEEAASFYRRALDVQGRTLPADSFEVINSMTGLAGSLRLSGRYEEAVPYYRSMVEYFTRVFGSEDQRTRTAELRLRDTLDALGTEGASTKQSSP